MRTDAVIFDKSGTLDDDRMPVYLANVKLMAEIGRTLPAFEEWCDSVTENIFDYWREHGITENHERLYRKYKEYYKSFCDNGHPPTLFKDVNHTLESLADLGLQTAVLSSHPTQLLEAELEKYGIRDHFMSVKGGSSCKAADLARICRTLDVLPEHAIYVGDTIYDVRAARTAGVNPIAVCTGYHSKQKLELEGARVIDSLSVLLQVV